MKEIVTEVLEFARVERGMTIFFTIVVAFVFVLVLGMILEFLKPGTMRRFFGE